QGIAWQDAKQSRAIADNRQLMSNSRVGDLAADAVRMGSAAQAFNQKLLSIFTSSNISFLNSEALIRREITAHPDLIRFSADKIDEALAYYREDDADYEKALNRDFSLPEEERKLSIFDNQKEITEAGKQYALKVIGEIQ